LKDQKFEIQNTTNIHNHCYISNNKMKMNFTTEQNLPGGGCCGKQWKDHIKPFATDTWL